MPHDMGETNIRPAPDQELTAIADYTANYVISSPLAFSTARYCLMDALSCALLALHHPHCTRLLGPIVPNTTVPAGSRVPGTNYVLDPITAAFNIGALIRWLDFNDTWLAAEWGHPSDNLGAILAVADFVSQQRAAQGQAALTVHDVLSAMIKTYEIQGVLALENSFNRLGLDHVALVKIASTALSMQLLGGSQSDITNALSHAFIDGQSLRTYRHAPNTGSRKSWAAGDATSRAVRLAWLVSKGEPGYPSALTVPKWGFYDVTWHGGHMRLPQPFGSYVMENILFKIAFPAEFHAQTAVECALKLYPESKGRLDDIEKIVLTTQESAIRIISKTGKLYNPADRDHCLQYMVAVGLIFGELTAASYEDDFARDPRIDKCRATMVVTEDPNFTKDYLNPEKRSIANAVQIYFKDGTHSKKIQIDYPIGHQRRREEGLPLLLKKFENSCATLFSAAEISGLMELFADEDRLASTPVHELMSMLAR